MQGLIAIAARRFTPPGFERAMVRRRLPQPPPSRLAIGARRLAISSLPVAALAIIIERAGLLEFRPVLATFAAALALAAIAILLAIAALVVIWSDGCDGARNRRMDAGLSGLPRRQGLPTTGNQRHPPRSTRSAAF